MQRLHFCESWRTNRGRVPTDYLLSARVFWPKALLHARNWVIRNRYCEYSFQYKKNNFMLNANFRSSNLICICPKYNIYEKLSTVFSVAVFRFWGEIKPPTPVFYDIYFQLHWKPLYLVICSSFLNLSSHSCNKIETFPNKFWYFL